MRFFIFILCLFLVPTFAWAESSSRIASLKNTTTNVRAGPGTQYPILWVFKHKNWPIRIISEYQSWHKITDHEGETGWIYKNLISSTHTVVVSEGDPTLMYRTSEMTKPIMKLSENVVLKFDKCTPYICQVVYDKRKGWVVKDRLLMVE
jgi:SH3-like domain-containing protein